MSNVRVDLDHNRKPPHPICDQIQSTLKNSDRTVRLNLGLCRRQNSRIHIVPRPNLQPNPFASCPMGIVIFPRRSPFPIKPKSKQKSQCLPNTSMVLHLSMPMTPTTEIQVLRPRLHLRPPAPKTSTTPSPPSLRKKRKLPRAASLSRATRTPTSHDDGADC